MKLYASEEHESDQEYLNSLNTTKVTPLDKIKLDRVIDMDEVRSAMLAMKKGKSPGTDGLPVEFYRTFWNDIYISVILYDVYQEAVLNGQLHLSACQGIISLMEKTGKDPLS